MLIGNFESDRLISKAKLYCSCIAKATEGKLAKVSGFKMLLAVFQINFK